MDIREVIEKAPDGKYRRACWEYGRYIYKDADTRLSYGEDNVCFAPHIEDLTATDWEVVPRRGCPNQWQVKERIEVGDTVEKDPCVSSRSGCHVLAIERVGSCVIYALHQRERACACVAQPDNHLTLIRKGPNVHTFEGIKWFGVKDGEDEILWPGSVNGSCQRTRIEEAVSKSKTYRMTLEVSE